MKGRASAGQLLIASVTWLAVALSTAPATAGVSFFPLPLYATTPNEGGTYGFLPVFMYADANGQVQSITAPSVSWNRWSGVNGTFRYYRYFNPRASWSIIGSASVTLNRNLWFRFDDDRVEPRTSTLNISARVRQNIFYRFFGLGPDTTPADESSYTRLSTVMTGRWGWNFLRGLNLAGLVEVHGDQPKVHTIGNLPSTQAVYPDAPGLATSAFVREGVSLRYDDRDGGDYARVGVASELSASIAEAITGADTFGELIWHTRALLPETSWLQGAGRLYWRQTIGDLIPFYDQASLGGEVLLRGFPEDRFIDKGAWEAEIEQRIRLYEGHFFGVTTDWRLDPFVAVGQVYSDLALFSHVRYAGGFGLRTWIKPDIVGRVDLAWGGEGLRAYVTLGYPY